jgi:glutamyl/glutaminyl-tRNA synthetase
VSLFNLKKTRLAPTPSGYLHTGNIFSFCITAFLARRHYAKVLLRIDDIDRERVRPEYEQDIFETLQFLDIPWDEGPRNMLEFENEFSQLHRLPQYQALLDDLVQMDLVFACDCSRKKLTETDDGCTCRTKDLSLSAPDVSWRLDTSTPQHLAIRSVAGETSPVRLPPEMKDFVVRKRDGMPSYQLTSLADDVYFGIDLVVRGLDLWPSTCAQLYLAVVLSLPAFSNTHFLHHPLLLSPDEKKLSKSAGDTSVQYLRKHGKTREEIFQLIGEQLRLPVPVTNWMELGKAAIETIGQF